MTTNLKEELSKCLERNEKPPVFISIKNKFTLINPNNWFNKIKYNLVPAEDTVSNDWVDVSSKDCCPKLSKFQRITGFFICIGLGFFFFCTALLLLPVLILKTRKFSALFTLGSLFMIFSFSFLVGPKNHFKQLFSNERLLFTCCYFSTLCVTLYFALAKHNTPFTVLFAVLQIISLMWFMSSFIPGGYTVISFFPKLFFSSVPNQVSKALPV